MNRFTVALGVALLVFEASAATVIIATNDHNESPWLTIGLAVSAGVAFVLSGLVALARRPENRTGVFLAATGYLWFFGALADSQNEWVFTAGFVFGNVLWVPFSALVLAYPTGRLETRLERMIPVAAGVLLVVPALLAAFLDPHPAPSCDTCPGSAIALAESDSGTAVELFTTISGLGLIAVIVAILVRRWRNASRALRRLLWPVVGAGIATLLAVGLVVIADQISSSVADAFQLLFFASFAAVPVSFMFGILRSRLARSSVTDVVVALQRGVPLREALAEALGDPSLEISYRLTGSSRWVDAEGRSIPEPSHSAGRAQKTIERVGMPIAVLDYEAHLADEPELVDAVTAAAGLALHNERLQAELRAEINPMRSAVPIVFGFVLAFAFLLLLITFRSVVIPLKAILMNLLSVAAAYGVVVAVFQWGWGENLLDFNSNGGVAAWLPMFLFVILFGLSMDYHVFILSRVREYYDRGLDTEHAVAKGIKSTAGVVTSAAVVMVLVFGVFALMPIIDMKEMGIGLAAAILIDATIVRAVLLPATMKLLGKWNWYLPAWLGWLPRLEHERSAEPAPQQAAA